MKKLNQVMRVCVAAALATFAGTAVAGGLAIGTQSGSGTGNAFAGGAASAEDASTVWYNPAGMTALPGKTNFSIAVHAIKPSFKFQNTASTLPIGTGEGGDGGDWALIPQMFVTTKLTDKWSIGAAFNTPFGLKTEYDAGWRGQVIANKSSLKTYNFNVSAAYKLNDVVSLGWGLNYQRVELDFNSVTPFGLFGPTLSDNGYGYNAGALFQVQPQTRIGVHYRSSINYQATGSLTAPAALGGNGSATAGLTAPNSASLSIFHALSPRWDLMADVTWTGEPLEVAQCRAHERRVDRCIGHAPYLQLDRHVADIDRRQFQAERRVEIPLRGRLRQDADQRRRPYGAGAGSGSHLDRDRRAV